MPKFGALDNTTVGQHSRDDFRKVLEAQGFLCFFCGIPIVSGSLDPNCEATEEHLVPRSRGGVDFIWNIVAACLQCNRLKGEKLPGEFLRERWSVAQLVDHRAHKSTRIPFSKERVRSVTTDPDEGEYDDQGNWIAVASHLEVSPFTGSMVRALSRAVEMERKPTEQRREVLRAQIDSLMRMRLEAAGQMPLNFDKPKPVASAPDESANLVEKGLAIAAALRRQRANLIPPTDEAALVVNGMHLTEPLRRKA